MIDYMHSKINEIMNLEKHYKLYAKYQNSEPQNRKYAHSIRYFPTLPKGYKSCVQRLLNSS
jgi:hypothetical protein